METEFGHFKHKYLYLIRNNIINYLDRKLELKSIIN